MNVSDLTPAHVGQVVTIRHMADPHTPDWMISGPLVAVCAEQDVIYDQTFTEAEPRAVYGRPVVHVTVGPFTAAIQDPGRTVVHVATPRPRSVA